MAETHAIPYKVLGPNELRLVSLQPGFETDKISCQIIYISFDQVEESHEYEALSYEWGSLDLLQPISIDGVDECYIRDNLWWALYHLRLTTKPRVLWIDALCINQGDVIERNHQVGMMDRIYRSAREIAIWVGRERPPDPDAISYLKDICLEDDLPEKIEASSNEDSDYKHREVRNRCWLYSHREKWELILLFSKRTYWTRLWIIQEVVLAADATIYCGHHSIHWIVVARVSSAVTHIAYNEDDVSDSVCRSLRDSPMSNVLLQKLNLSTSGGTSPLADLMLLHSDSQCLDPRDKVFGILSLVDSCCRDAVTLDYTQSPYTVGNRLLKHHNRCHGTEGFASIVSYIGNLLLRKCTPKDLHPCGSVRSQSVEDTHLHIRHFQIPEFILGVEFPTQFLHGNHNTTTTFVQSVKHLGSKHLFETFKVALLASYGSVNLNIEICISSSFDETRLTATMSSRAAFHGSRRRDQRGITTLSRDQAGILLLNAIGKFISEGCEYMKGSTLNTLFITERGEIGFGQDRIGPGDILVQADSIGESTMDAAEFAPCSTPLKSKKTSTLLIKGETILICHVPVDSDSSVSRSLPRFPLRRAVHFHPNVSAYLVGTQAKKDNLSISGDEGRFTVFLESSQQAQRTQNAVSYINFVGERSRQKSQQLLSSGDMGFPH